MFKVKRLSVDAGSNYSAIITKDDAEELGLAPKEKVTIICSYSKKELICDSQVYDCDKHCSVKLKRGELALYEKAYNQLHASPKGVRAKLIPAPKPQSFQAVNDKFYHNKELSEEDFKLIITEILENKYSEVGKTFFVLACAAHGLKDKEVIGLTNAMVSSGKILDFKKKKNDIIVDKHCIGGIPNNRTTMIVIPILAAAGLKIPKTSSRAITSAAGTADTMEVLANVEVSLSKMHTIVNEIGGCLVWGGGDSLSPADDVIIEIERALEVDSQGQMIASILSKKKCAGSTHVLIDIPVGPQAKIRSHKKAQELKRRFEVVGKAIGLDVIVIITQAKEPIGNGVGPYHEAVDVLSILNNEIGAPDDLREKALMMAGLVFEEVKLVKKSMGYDYAKALLETGKALRIFEEIRDAQGRKELPSPPKYSYDIIATSSGKISAMNTKAFSKASFLLGAPENKVAGMRVHKKIGEKIEKGDVLCTLYTTSKLKLEYAHNYILKCNDFIEIT